MISAWLQKLRNLFKQPPLLILKDVLDKVPGQPLRISSFLVLDLSENPSKPLREYGTVRAGTPADVPGMCLLENKQELFLDRFDKGESCLIALNDREVVGYIWFSDKHSHMEQRYNYRLDIPEDSIYSYDCFIHQAYRLRGIWVLFQKRLFERAKMLGRKRIITMVDYANTASLKTHLRYGYAIRRNVLWIRCFTSDHFLACSPAQRRDVMFPFQAG
ncbi:GNAT family N-acetyltransferase [Geomonas agri]|uniref:GNAT family N-acetyltransferase n=1 Tax=Geomonas agri TaxID=2873702 RepID=UPI001CD69E52|nr:GNAT family N-acetyltransferase [Geomonas agri]